VLVVIESWSTFSGNSYKSLNSGDHFWWYYLDIRYFVVLHVNCGHHGARLTEFKGRPLRLRLCKYSYALYIKLAI